MSRRNEHEKIEDATEILRRGMENWNYLDGEERHGTVVQAFEVLTK